MGAVEKNLGLRVAGLRKVAGLTQAGLAERCGVATETISRIERGAAVPSIQRLVVIASILEVELPVLFNFNDRPSPKDEAIERLMAIVGRRNARDIDVLAGVAALIFDHFTARR